MCARAPVPEPKLILLVDVCEESNAFWAAFLQMWGFRVKAVQTGEAAILHVSEEMPSVVLLDVALPDVTGYEVARQIRAVKGSRPLLIALTDKSQPFDLIAGSEADFDLHVIKPADPDLIRLILEGYCHSENPSALSD